MNQSVRIAHILPWAGVGGTEHATLRIAQAVEGERFRNVIFFVKGADSVAELFTAAGFPVQPFEPPEPSLRHGPEFVGATRKLATLLRANGIDLVHCSDYLAGFTSALAGRWAGLPVLCHIRNRFETITRRDRLFLKPIQKFAFVSKDTWRRFDYPVAPDRGVVVYDGLDSAVLQGAADATDVRKEFGFGPSDRIVGMVARVAPQKDYETLVRAAVIVSAALPETRFLIVGDKSSSEVNRRHFTLVEEWLAAAGVREGFTFTDSRSDVPRLIRSMDVFVLSTHHEGLPLVILEAMAHARPVVATNVDGIPEVVEDGRTGLLFASGDAATLARHIIDLLRNPQRAQLLGDAGLEALRSRFSRERFARDIQLVYEQMLPAGRTDTPGRSWL